MKRMIPVVTLFAFMFISTYAIAQEVVADNMTATDNSTTAEKVLVEEIVPVENMPADATATTEAPVAESGAEKDVIVILVDDNTSECKDETCVVVSDEEIKSDNETDQLVLLMSDIICEVDIEIPIKTENGDNATVRVSKLCKDSAGEVINGIVRDMLDNSSVILNEYTFESGILKGAMKTYYEDTGSLWIESNFDDAALHGAKKLYRKDGTLEHETNFVYGIQSGASVGYYPTGKVEWENSYLGNMLNGEAKTFYPNGVLKQSQMYANDILSGPQKDYSKDGKLIADFNYDNNILLSGNCYNAEGVKSEMSMDDLNTYAERNIIPCN